MCSTPSDITLAVGDGARRHHWPRQVGNDGIVRVIVPLGQVRTVPRTTSPKGPETIGFPGPGPAHAMAHGTDPRRTATGGPGTGLGSDAALAAVLLLSLGLWAVLWGAVGWLASAVSW
jgi:hypothetical protein